MSLPLDVAAQEIEAALELPRGYAVTVEHEHDAIVIGNDRLAFSITRDNVDRGMHIEIAKHNLPRLIKAADQWLFYAEPASYWMQ